MSERFYEEYGSENQNSNTENRQNSFDQNSNSGFDSNGFNRGYDQNGYNTNRGYDPNGYNQNSYNNYNRPKREPLAIASLVLGIIGLVLGLLSCCCAPQIAILFVIVNMAGIVTGILSRKGKRMEGVAIAGIVMSIFGLLLTIFFIAIYALVLSDPAFIQELEAIYESMGIDLEQLQSMNGQV